MKRITDFKTFYLLNPYSNQEVTSLYCEIISRALSKLGISVKTVASIEKDKANKKLGIIVVRTGDAWKAKRYHFGYIVTWIQGVAPEETWLSLRKISRYLIVMLLEILGLMSSDFNFYCSERMAKHYKKRFIVKAKNSYIMPCFNDELNQEHILNKDYSQNVFVFAGGMDKWQCFNKTAAIFKKIEEMVPSSFFRVYARDKELAEKELKALGVKNYSVDYVSQEQLKEEFKTAKFGFCIRDNIEVNRVATPTKLSNYVSSGIIPIYSKCIDGFYQRSKDNEFALCVDSDSFINDVIKLCSSTIENTKVAGSFMTCYKDYYSSDYHINRIVDTIRTHEK